MSQATSPPCTVEDCETPRRSGRSPYCEKHYYRLRRTGRLDRERPWQRNNGSCSVADCDEPSDRRGMCTVHYIRFWRNGHTDFIAYSERAWPTGPDNYAWTGDDASYVAAHQRLHKARGAATSHSCTDCGNPARHWSYDREDPDERSSDLGPYSVDLDHYAPRCVPCHKRFDLAHIAKEARRDRTD